MQVEQYVMAYGAEQAFTAENAAAILCGQVLGAYVVKFERTSPEKEIQL